MSLLSLTGTSPRPTFDHEIPGSTNGRGSSPEIGNSFLDEEAVLYKRDGCHSDVRRAPSDFLPIEGDPPMAPDVDHHA